MDDHTGVPRLVLCMSLGEAIALSQRVADATAVRPGPARDAAVRAAVAAIQERVQRLSPCCWVPTLDDVDQAERHLVAYAERLAPAARGRRGHV